MAASLGVGAEESRDAAGMNAALKDAPVNTWVKLSEEATGTRGWPLFAFDPSSGKFVISGGEARKNAHADTEYFDVAAGKWTNVHSPGSTGKAESGPSDAPGARFDREKDLPLKAATDGAMRIVRGVNPYVWDPGLYSQWTRNPEDGRIYAYFFDSTLTFEPKTAAWTDLKVPKFSQSHGQWLLYGTLGYDPVNKEIVSIGGTSDEDGGTPGTWTFSPAGKEWKKLATGSRELNELNAGGKLIHARVAAVINAARNRFYMTESESEAKQDIAAAANEVTKQIEELIGKLNAARLSGFEVDAPKAAAAELVRVAAGLKTFAGTLAGAIAGETLAGAQDLIEAADRAERALDAEPCGRGASPAVTCPELGKIVLFSGCRLDGYLADTWVYDCKTRTWEQRRPKVCPAPRAGHVMAWLPRSRKVVLYGGVPFFSGYGVPHGNARPPQDLWVYDVESNEWKMLAAPAKDSPLNACGAVDDNDTLIAVGVNPKDKYSRMTYGMKVDASAPDAGSATNGAAPGSATIVFDTPADYDKVTKPDPGSVAKLLKELPANQWTLMPAPPKKVNSHGWGTCPYDTVRHQWISFGGGHSGAHFNDVAHYSLRTSTWSWGYGEEYPYQNASFSAFFNQTFRNRPTVPTHVWDCGAFDEVSGKVVYCVRGATWVYDPVAREWEYPVLWENGGGTKVNMGSTPRGVVYLDWQGNLQLYDVKARAWSKLPVNGGKLPAAYCDTGGICYDSKRDCLWIGHGGPMVCYDMKTGEVTGGPASGKPECVYMRGAAYIPELDMILSAGRQTAADGQIGNLAYDIGNQKWIGLAFPCSDGQPRTNEKSYSNINLSMAYDPALKIAVLHSNQAEVLLARIDKAQVKTFEVKMEEPKKRK